MKILIVGILAVAFAGCLDAESDQAGTRAPEPELAPEASEAVGALRAEPAAPVSTLGDPGATRAIIVMCGAYQGKSCPMFGHRFSCFNDYPYEPGACFCWSDLVWDCG